MRFSEAVGEALKEKKMTRISLGDRMGMSRSYVSTMLMRNNPYLNAVLEMAEAMDYEIVLQPKRTAGKRPVGQIVIEKGDEE